MTTLAKPRDHSYNQLTHTLPTSRQMDAGPQRLSNQIIKAIQPSRRHATLTFCGRLKRASEIWSPGGLMSFSMAAVPLQILSLSLHVSILRIHYHVTLKPSFTGSHVKQHIPCKLVISRTQDT